MCYYIFLFLLQHLGRQWTIFFRKKLFQTKVTVNSALEEFFIENLKNLE